MKAPSAEPGCWPTANQLLLLRAALCGRESAADAWRQWNAVCDLERDSIDIGSYRLLPLVHRNLQRHSIDTPGAGILRGLYKRTWYENQLRLRTCADTLRALHEAGIATLVLKGCPLALQYYADVGARPMADIDLLVPKPQARHAASVLAGMGWSPVGVLLLSDANLDLSPGRGFSRAGGAELDLHCHVLHFGLGRVTERFWEGSIPLDVQGVATLALQPADQLLHVCAHGLVWNEVPPLRWVSDAMFILETAGDDLDWSRLLALSAVGNASLQLHAALDYLQREFAARVPDYVLPTLARTGSTRAQRGLFATLSRGGRWRGAWLLWYGFRFSERYAGAAWNPFAFLDYLRIVLGKRDAWQVASWAVARTAARLVRIPSRPGPDGVPGRP